ncbi:YjcG family protein [Halalkalibacter akibai]|uniref:Putative phosphoesterase JCM9157_481 n=1 Tax=Halalkalibacter akibai (strain ATCC 43226 / DSM 21942 / CIP 109018 / JCM 9157 / 1139) TaxID=1236973 RepID=W4QP99_HALA3|nr:YjcG family protein [Halalkalibacter akibai]GAE33478.1 phosphoesterase [Halalkalibacter akibai JCM 9157]
MKYGIALFPSKPLQDQANSYRMRYDSHYALIPPHITLKETFEVDDSDLPQLLANIREVAKNAEPALIEVYKVDTFSPQSNTIFFKIREDVSLTNLYEALHSDPFEPNPKYGFIPHLTIGQDLSNDEHADVVGRLKMGSFSHQETINRMQLLYQLENGSWTVYETFHLGKEA